MSDVSRTSSCFPGKCAGLVGGVPHAAGPHARGFAWCSVCAEPSVTDCMHGRGEKKTLVERLLETIAGNERLSEVFSSAKWWGFKRKKKMNLWHVCTPFDVRMMMMAAVMMPVQGHAKWEKNAKLGECSTLSHEGKGAEISLLISEKNR